MPASRGEAAALLTDVLSAACPAGEVCLIGSMATPNQADEFSDIDIRWTLPKGQAARQLESLRPTLLRVGGVESLRVDPDERADSRLVFVRFHGWPLWWRVDLEIHAPGLGSMDIPYVDAWSAQESACMGVLVTVKALARHRPELAEELFVRALRRVDATDVAGDWPLRIESLLDQLAASSPHTAHLVSRVRRLARHVVSD